MAVFREVTHGLFTFNAAPFNSMYFLSLLAVHELTPWSKRNIHGVFKFLWCVRTNLINIPPFGSLFQCCLKKKKRQKTGTLLFEQPSYVLLAAQCLWTLCPACPLALIWWLTFQVPDLWNSINLTDFSGNRPVEFHRSSWFLKCQTKGLPLIWSLKFHNALHLSTFSKN